MKKNLILLADIESTTTVAYLDYFKRNNLKFYNIIYFKIIKKKTFFNFLKKFIKKILNLFNLYSFKSNFLINNSDEIQRSFKIKNKVNYEQYFNKLKLEKVHLIENFSDLYKILLPYRKCNFLYTDGGIVPKFFFKKKLNIFHCHPGILPKIRGTDCFFWSLLIRGKIGFTVFKMNEKIDDGQILFRKEYGLKVKNFKNILKKYSISEIYTLILYYIDPHYRAKTLLNFIINKKISPKTNKYNSRTYYFKKIDSHILKQLFKIFNT